MTAPQRITRHLQLIRVVGRSVAIALIWLLVVGFGTAVFFPPGAPLPPRASEDWDSFNNALVFASSTAITSALATAFTFAIAGKRKWALEVVIAVTFTVAVLTTFAYTGLWLAPSLARSRLGYWEFVRLQDTTLRWSTAIVRHQIPLGAVVGMLAGAVAGNLAILSRRHPRIAMWLMLGLLCACVSELVQHLVFELVLFCCLFVRWWIWSPGVTVPYVPASGATFGAIAGAIIAAVAMWRQRAQPSVEDNSLL